jgi:hypothetical protein
MEFYKARQAVLQAVIAWEGAKPGVPAGRAWRAFEKALDALVQVARGNTRPLAPEADVMEAG